MHKNYVIKGVVEFRPATSTLHDLTHPDDVVVLNSPAGRCLLLLIERAGTIVTQQEFMDIVWRKRGMLVSPNTYYQNIYILRKGLREIGFVDDPIVTIPRIGLTLASDTHIQIKESVCMPVVAAEEQESNQPPLISPPCFIPQDSVCAEDDIDLTPTPTPTPTPTSTPKVLTKVNVASDSSGLFFYSPLFLSATLFLVALMLAGIGAVRLHVYKKEHFFDNYHFAISAAGCHFYLPTYIKAESERDTMLAYGKRFSAYCGSYPWVYISGTAMRPRVSVIRCDEPMSKPNRCISDYFIEER
nr:winged helix-turn-helix domain-containing protein [Pantoea sp. 201603H]